MKTLRIIAIIVLAANIFCLHAQTITIHKVDGTKLEYHCGEVDSIVNYQIMPETEKHEVVDLGLSVLWATCNVGAEKPFQGGNKYAWGETEPRMEFNRDYYWFNASSDEYVDIGQNISGTIYDAAHIEWGGDWRMPIYEEMEELVNKCTWQWVTLAGVYGFFITGPNGNRIFLPAANYHNNANSNSNTHKYYADYWTGSLRHKYCSWQLHINGYYNFLYGATSNAKEISSANERYFLYFIRPVKNK